MKHIRPHQVLNIPDHLGDEINYFMPPSFGGSPLVLESIMLIKLLKVVDPDQIFEFGTFMGITTRLLLENLSEKQNITKRIHTLDLPSTDGVTFQGDGNQLASKAIKNEKFYNLSNNKNLVNQIFQDSMNFNCEEYKNKIQYIFIDANHHEDYVKNDTKNAINMIGGTPACIIWHDYGNPEYPELTSYLDQLSLEMPLYHIEETMLVFYPVGFEIK